MLHTAGFLADRPVDVEVLIGADGPKGTAVAERVGDGVFAAGVPNPAAAGRPYSLSNSAPSSTTEKTCTAAMS